VQTRKYTPLDTQRGTIARYDTWTQRGCRKTGNRTLSGERNGAHIFGLIGLKANNARGGFITKPLEYYCSRDLRGNNRRLKVECNAAAPQGTGTEPMWQKICFDGTHWQSRV